MESIASSLTLDDLDALLRVTLVRLMCRGLGTMDDMRLLVEVENEMELRDSSPLTKAA